MGHDQKPLPPQRSVRSWFSKPTRRRLACQRARRKQTDIFDTTRLPAFGAVYRDRSRSTVRRDRRILDAEIVKAEWQAC
jgi:hypothetical protein